MRLQVWSPHLVGLVPFSEEAEIPECKLSLSFLVDIGNGPREDTGGKHLSTSQEETSHQELNLLAPWSWTLALAVTTQCHRLGVLYRAEIYRWGLEG